MGRRSPTHHGASYGSGDAKIDRYWPADLQIVGKEISTSTVYWPAFLMAGQTPSIVALTAL